MNKGMFGVYQFLLHCLVEFNVATVEGLKRLLVHLDYSGGFFFSFQTVVETRSQMFGLDGDAQTQMRR